MPFVTGGQARGPGSKGVMEARSSFSHYPAMWTGPHTRSRATRHGDSAGLVGGPWGRAGQLAEKAGPS